MYKRLLYTLSVPEIEVGSLLLEVQGVLRCYCSVVYRSSVCLTYNT